MKRRSFLGWFGKGAAVVATLPLLRLPEPVEAVETVHVPTSQIEPTTEPGWTITSEGDATLTVWYPLRATSTNTHTAIRGEDYPVLARIWENDEDAAAYDNWA